MNKDDLAPLLMEVARDYLRGVDEKLERAVLGAITKISALESERNRLQAEIYGHKCHSLEDMVKGNATTPWDLFAAAYAQGMAAQVILAEGSHIEQAIRDAVCVAVLAADALMEEKKKRESVNG